MRRESEASLTGLVLSSVQGRDASEAAVISAAPQAAAVGPGGDSRL